jgi:amino acid transporter
VGVQNAASRYLFALGRGGVFPGKLANIHPKYKSPYVGNIVQTAVTALLFIACVAQGADAFRHLFGIGGGLANMGSQTMYLLVSLSAIVFFRRFGITENESLWKTVTAPALAIALAGMIIVLTIIKFDILTENAGWVRWIWITIPIALILGYSASYFGGRKTGMAAAFNPKFVNNRPMEID